MKKRDLEIKLEEINENFDEKLRLWKAEANRRGVLRGSIYEKKKNTIEKQRKRELEKANRSFNKENSWININSFKGKLLFWILNLITAIIAGSFSAYLAGIFTQSP